MGPGIILNEVNHILQIVKILLLKGIESKDIGIITPYSQQKSKINNALKDKCRDPTIKINYIIVGSVDGFQGREKDYIILSSFLLKIFFVRIYLFCER